VVVTEAASGVRAIPERWLNRLHRAILRIHGVGADLPQVRLIFGTIGWVN
jgi:hypothetical protein